jgi:bifunctional lysine-specific demethylase and histidyl-hydroxylase NO66
MSTLGEAARQTEQGPAAAGRAVLRCVADPAAFASAWGSRPLLATAAELARPFDDLFDLHTVDELLSRRGLRTPFLRMAKDGVVVDSARFTRAGGVGAAVGDQVDDTAVMRLFAEGTTIVLQALHRLWPPVIDFAGELTADLGHPVQVNAYVTPAASRGFSAHYDIHDVFVLQVAGEKRWIVHEPVHPWPLRSQPWTRHRAAVERAVAETPSILDEVLRPGDALYLPRGFLHAAEALGGVSAHLTVGIHVVTRYALVEALLAEAADDPELRRSLPVGVDLGDPSVVAAELEPTIDALMDRLDHADAGDIAARLRRSLVDASRPAPIAPLEQAAAVEHVHPEASVRLRRGVHARLERNASGLRLHHAGGMLDVEPGVEDALVELLLGEPRQVASLPGDEAAVRALVRSLLLHGLLVPAR